MEVLSIYKSLQELDSNMGLLSNLTKEVNDYREYFKQILNDTDVTIDHKQETIMIETKDITQIILERSELAISTIVKCNDAIELLSRGRSYDLSLDMYTVINTLHNLKALCNQAILEDNKLYREFHNVKEEI